MKKSILKKCILCKIYMLHSVKIVWILYHITAYFSKQTGQIIIRIFFLFQSAIQHACCKVLCLIYLTIVSDPHHSYKSIWGLCSCARYHTHISAPPVLSRPNKSASHFPVRPTTWIKIHLEERHGKETQNFKMNSDQSKERNQWSEISLKCSSLFLWDT